MRGSVVARANLRSSSTISLFPALFFVPGNAEKPVSYSQVDGKSIKSRMAVLATLGYENNMADQYAGKVFSLKASFAVESLFRAINSSWEESSPLNMLTRSVSETRYGFLTNAK